jgi:hypothetical protein
MQGPHVKAVQSGRLAVRVAHLDHGDRRHPCASRCRSRRRWTRFHGISGFGDLKYHQLPKWTYDKVRTAHWHRFSHPDKLPEYGASAFPIVWWWNAAKAAKTAGRR